MSAEGQFLVGKVGFELLLKSGWKLSHLGGLTLGADPITYAIAHESWAQGKPIDGFTVRKQPKEHGTGRQIEGGLPENSRVVVIEDSMTTGGSAMRAIDALGKYGAEVVGILTLVDREDGGRERIESAGYPLLSAFTAQELLESS